MEITVLSDLQSGLTNVVMPSLPAKGVNMTNIAPTDRNQTLFGVTSIVLGRPRLPAVEHGRPAVETAIDVQSVFT